MVCIVCWSVCAEPATRERIRAEVLEQDREWDQTFVAGMPPAADQTLQGQSIAAIASRRALDPIEALFAVLDESAGEASMVHFVMDEQDVRFVMRHPLSMFGSDGFGLAPDGSWARASRIRVATARTRASWDTMCARRVS